MPYPASFDPEVFSAFELDGWQRVAAYYSQTFADITIQSAEPLLDACNVKIGMQVLDIATGQGDVAALAAQRGAKVMGVDFSTAMLAIARQRYPYVEFCEGNASALPFEDASFDAVTINFGLLHFSNPEQALHEAWRVLRSGARIGFTIWASPEEAIGFGIILQAVADYGQWQVSLPVEPATFQFSDEQECAQTLRNLDFTAPTITRLPLQWTLPSSASLFTAMSEGTVRTGSLLLQQPPELLTTIRNAIESSVQTHERNGTIMLPMPALLVSALKP